MKNTLTVRGTRALTAAAVLLATWLFIAVAELSGLMPEATSQAWAEIVANSKDAIAHE